MANSSVRVSPRFNASMMTKRLRDRCACGNELTGIWNDCTSCFADKYEHPDA